jgi:hypothetical protein
MWVVEANACGDESEVTGASVIRRRCFGCNTDRPKDEFQRGKNRCNRCLTREPVMPQGKGVRFGKRLRE